MAEMGVSIDGGDSEQWAVAALESSSSVMGFARFTAEKRSGADSWLGRQLRRR